MENIKKQSVKAYLLLESLISIFLLTLLVGTALSALVNSREKINQIRDQMEGINVAEMAVDSGLTKLSANHQEISIVQNKKELLITNHGEEIVKLEMEN